MSDKMDNRACKQGMRHRLPLLAGSAIVMLLSTLAGCSKPPPPPPAPPPPVVVIPPMPTPPMGAPLQMTIPPVAADGQRHTVNYGISTAQAVWNLRSGYNVAALTCGEAEYLPILDGYKRFLKLYDKSLDKASLEIDRSFQTQHKGRAAIVARETYQTQVYNFFSLPMVDTAFCKAAMELSTDLLTVDPTQFEAFSYTGLAKLEAPFKEFFTAYEQYRADLAAWQARYGAGGLITVRPTAEQAQAQGQAQSVAQTPARAATSVTPLPQAAPVQPSAAPVSQPQAQPLVLPQTTTTAPGATPPITLPPTTPSATTPNITLPPTGAQ